MTTSRSAERGQLTLERTFKATMDEVWELWTTKEGIESWWGPDGFTTTVQVLDLRPGGDMRYTMTATGAPQVEFLKKAGLPISTTNRLTYSEIVPHRRLAYSHAVDFIPGIVPYDVDTAVEFFLKGDTVRMVVTCDTMHDAHWTEMAKQGWSSQLDRLVAALH